MKIRFQPRNGSIARQVPNFQAGSSFRDWAAGEERDIPEDATENFRMYPGGPVKSIRVLDALLSCGPEFVDAETGKNPDFTCTACGEETLDEFYIGPGEDHPQVWYASDQTDPAVSRLCMRDFLAQKPDEIPWHRTRGLSYEAIEGALARYEENGGKRADLPLAITMATPGFSASGDDVTITSMAAAADARARRAGRTKAEAVRAMRGPQDKPMDVTPREPVAATGGA